MKPQLRSLFSPRGLVATLSFMGLLVGAPRAARAHIKMSAPADWITTNAQGDPQKITPCGVDPTMPSTFTVTNAVTTLHVGDKVTFNWTETVPHDGHFRIALAINSRDELTDPAVTKKNSDGTAAEVAISTAYPVLADNLFPHTAASVSANKAYTYSVTIPNTPCTKCTLQLLQFMANHPLDPSYFYHQCADVTILAAAGSGGNGGSTSGTGGGGAGKSGGTGGVTSGAGGSGGKSGGTGGATSGAGGATSGTGGAITGSGGATSGTGGAITGSGGTTTGTGGATSGTGGQVATGSGGSAVGSGGDGATGSGGTGTGGTFEGGGSGGGCACQVGAANGNLMGFGILGLAVIGLRRRRRRIGPLRR
jgi:MYXO-CTERM domain-containing protein